MASGQQTGRESSDTKPTMAMTPKSVTIAEPESHTSYFDLGEPALGMPPGSPKLHRASGGKRLTGRSNRSSIEQLPKLLNAVFIDSSREGESSGSAANDHVHAHSRLHNAVSTWLKDERTKWDSRSEHRDKSYVQLAFEGLERILTDHPIIKVRKPVFPGPRRGSSSSKRLKHPPLISHPSHQSDTEWSGDDPVVPSTEEILDNSKTVDANGTKGEITVSFKNDIIKLAHTLKLKGWRRIPLDAGDDIEVTRLSGALTNAVYVVFPPKELPPPTETASGYVSKRTPLKLLLRVYGPQADHLIDREKELAILKRLSRKRIGPRLLGTFLNGRFEQFLHAKTLTARELHDRETSKQIAKRMRELHEGIDLTHEERAAGPFVWQNWDRWVKRCEEVISWLDEQVLNYDGSTISKSDVWKRRGLVCGVPWLQFRQTVERYRQWLKEKYGGGQALRESLVFAHNDTQYGNILRIEPSGESPLLLPSNEHKQLVVIDFEYANANTPGHEFANHFTEWCYDYHAERSWACNTERYPNPEEQTRFIKAYILHQAKYQAPPAPSGSTHPSPILEKSMPGSRAPPPSSGSSHPSPSLERFMLGARAPPNYTYKEEERAREREIETEVKHLMDEARIWRVANSAQWVAWGIVQAKIAGMEEALAELRKEKESVEAGGINTQATLEKHESIQREEHALECEQEATPLMPHEHEMNDDDGFDCLAYSQDRAMFFWGDLLEMGFVKEVDLPDAVLQRAKRLKY